MNVTVLKAFKKSDRSSARFEAHKRPFSLYFFFSSHRRSLIIEKLTVYFHNSLLKDVWVRCFTDTWTSHDRWAHYTLTDTSPLVPQMYTVRSQMCFDLWEMKAYRVALCFQKEPNRREKPEVKRGHGRRCPTTVDKITQDTMWTSEHTSTQRGECIRLEKELILKFDPQCWDIMWARAGLFYIHNTIIFKE